MELEEMRTAWSGLLGKAEQHGRLPDHVILGMTRKRYLRSLNGIRTPELAGTVCCLTFAGWILVCIQQFDGLLLAAAITCALLLITLPALSIRSILKMSNPPLENTNYRQIMDWYLRGKRRFLRVQKVSVYLGFMLLMVALPVMLKLMNGNFSKISIGVWALFIAAGTVFYLLFVTWVLRHYIRAISKLELLLGDLQDDQ
jgi:hypothetical protein